MSKRRRTGSSSGEGDGAVTVMGKPAAAAEDGFDPETGSFVREIQDYSQSKRGYGDCPKNDEFPFLNPGITMIVGPTGSGKTNVTRNLLDETYGRANPKRFNKIMYYTGSPQDELLRDLDPNIVDLYSPERTESLVEAIRGMKRTNQFLPEEQKKLTLMVLDDAGSNRTLLPEKLKGSEMGDFYVGHRHNKTHLFLPVQQWTMAPPFFRQNLSNLILFPGHSEVDMREIFRSFDLPPDQLVRQMQSIASDRHQFMYLNRYRRSAMLGFDHVVLQ